MQFNLDVGSWVSDKKNDRHSRVTSKYFILSLYFLMIAQIGKSRGTYILVTTFEPSSKCFICVYLSYLYV